MVLTYSAVFLMPAAQTSIILIRSRIFMDEARQG